LVSRDGTAAAAVMPAVGAGATAYSRLSMPLPLGGLLSPSEHRDQSTSGARHAGVRSPLQMCLPALNSSGSPPASSSSWSSFPSCRRSWLSLCASQPGEMTLGQPGVSSRRGTAAPEMMQGAPAEADVLPSAWRRGPGRWAPVAGIPPSAMASSRPAPPAGSGPPLSDRKRRLGNIDPGNCQQRKGGANASLFASVQFPRLNSSSVTQQTAGFSRTTPAETELWETGWLRRRDSNPVMGPTGQRKGAASLAIHRHPGPHLTLAEALRTAAR
jgi:hypothetical protein